MKAKLTLSIDKYLITITKANNVSGLSFKLQKIVGAVKLPEDFDQEGSCKFI